MRTSKVLTIFPILLFGLVATADTSNLADVTTDVTISTDIQDVTPDKSETPDNPTDTPDITDVTPDILETPENSSNITDVTPDKSKTPVNPTDTPDISETPDNPTDTPDISETPENPTVTSNITDVTPGISETPDNPTDTPDITENPTVTSNITDVTPDISETPDNPTDTPDITDSSVTPTITESTANEPTESVTVNPVTLPPNKQCTAHNASGIYPIGSDCSRYLVCFYIGGEMKGDEYGCPHPTYLNPSTKKCVLYKPAECEERKENLLCADKGGAGRYPNKNSCTQYLACFNGQVNGVIFTCPKGSYFNKNSAKCSLVQQPDCVK